MITNTITPRVFIAATRQNEGKTTTSLGLLSALQKHFPRIGYIKPVGQRFVEIEEQKIDEDTVLMDTVYDLDCPLLDMSPIAVEPDFTRKYLQSSNRDALVKKIGMAFDRVAWERDFVLCEGSGHAGVGSVFDLSNAQVAALLNAKVIIVTGGGIGRPIDEVSLNKALFDKEDVEIIGVIVNKVMPDKVDHVAEFVRRGLKRKGLDLLGVIPHQRILSIPSVGIIQDELDAELLNRSQQINNLVDDVVVGAMSVNNALRFFKSGVLLITPGDREDLVIAAAGGSGKPFSLAGIVLTGNLRPGPSAMKLIQTMPFPVLLAKDDSYQVASKVHDMIVKIQPGETEKIAVVRNMISQHVDVNKILKALDD
jgi:BioD-like phosphotransacetylase family protein